MFCTKFFTCNFFLQIHIQLFSNLPSITSIITYHHRSSFTFHPVVSSCPNVLNITAENIYCHQIFSLLILQPTSVENCFFHFPVHARENVPFPIFSYSQPAREKFNRRENVASTTTMLCDSGSMNECCCTCTMCLAEKPLCAKESV